MQLSLQSFVWDNVSNPLTHASQSLFSHSSFPGKLGRKRRCGKRVSEWKRSPCHLNETKNTDRYTQAGIMSERETSSSILRCPSVSDSFLQGGRNHTRQTGKRHEEWTISLIVVFSLSAYFFQESFSCHAENDLRPLKLRKRKGADNMKKEQRQNDLTYTATRAMMMSLCLWMLFVSSYHFDDDNDEAREEKLILWLAVTDSRLQTVSIIGVNHETDRKVDCPTAANWVESWNQAVVFLLMFLASQNGNRQTYPCP